MPPDPLTLRRRDAFISLAIVVAVFCLYFPSLTGQFHPLDDGQYVTANPFVSQPDWGGAATFFTEVRRPSTVQGYYQPLTMVSLMLDRTIQLAIAGGNTALSPVPFHATNIALHALNSVFVFFLIRRLIGHDAIACFLALLFAIHPINVECVTWISQRKSLLSTCFMLIAIEAYIRSNGPTRWRWYGVVLIAYTASLLSKPTALMLPLALLFLDVWPLRRLDRSRVLALLPLVAIAAIGAWIARTSQLASFSFDASEVYWPPDRAFLLACHGLTFYLSRTVVPVGLFPEYLLANEQLISLSTAAFRWGIAGSILFTAVLLYALHRRWTAAWSMMLAWLVMLAPTMTNVKFLEGIVADRFAYAPMFFALLLMAEGLRQVRIQHQLSAAIAAAFILCLVPLNLKQQYFCKDTLAYYKAIAQRYPELPRGRYCAARAALIEYGYSTPAGTVNSTDAKEKLRIATKQLQRAIELDPINAPAYVDLAEMLLAQDRYPEAIVAIQKAIDVTGGTSEAYALLGVIYSKTSRYPEAIEAYQRVLKQNPHLGPARKNLANALLMSGRAGEALQHFETYCSRYKSDLDASQNWGNALLMVGRVDDAIARLRHVVAERRVQINEMNSDEMPAAISRLAKAEFTLAGALAQGGHLLEARGLLQSALKAKPELTRQYMTNPAFEPIRRKQ